MRALYQRSPATRGSRDFELLISRIQTIGPSSSSPSPSSPIFPFHSVSNRNRTCTFLWCLCCRIGLVVARIYYTHTKTTRISPAQTSRTKRNAPTAQHWQHRHFLAENLGVRIFRFPKRFHGPYTPRAFHSVVVRNAYTRLARTLRTCAQNTTHARTHKDRRYGLICSDMCCCV